METLIVPLLNRLFGDVFANLEPQQLEMSLWNGKVQFKDLILKPDVFLKQGQPLEIISGAIGKLALEIPWKSLATSPLKIGLDNLDLVVKLADEHYDPELEFLIEQAAKEAGLKQDEYISEQMADTYSSRLVNSAISNLQISIKNISIKFRESSGNVIEAGFLLKELLVVNCGQDFGGELESKVTSSSNNIVYKLFKLTNMGVYCQQFDSNSIEGENEYLVAPVSGQGKLKWSKTSFPVYDLEVLFDSFGIILTDDQLKVVLNIVDNLDRRSKRKPYLSHRPPITVPVKLDPKAWFKYGIKSVMQDICKRREQWTWEYFKQRRDIRLTYIELYRKIYRNEHLPEELDQLRELEYELSLEDIRLYRRLALKGLAPKKQEVHKNTWYGNANTGSDGLLVLIKKWILKLKWKTNWQSCMRMKLIILQAMVSNCGQS